MTEEEKDYIKYILSYLEQPLYNSLEVGFRHSPLTNKEIIERYKFTCIHACNDLKYLLNKKD
jgi:hypothetical protein